jgi:hypothetical protein
MAASCCTCMTWGIVAPCVSVVVLAPHARVVRHGPRTSRNQGVVVRDRDLSCEPETCRGDSSCRELVGDAANWLKTGRLASVGLDQGPQFSLSRILVLMLSILAFMLLMVLDYLAFKEVFSSSKGGRNPGPRHRRDLEAGQRRPPVSGSRTGHDLEVRSRRPPRARPRGGRGGRRPTPAPIHRRSAAASRAWCRRLARTSSWTRGSGGRWCSGWMRVPVGSLYK